MSLANWLGIIAVVLVLSYLLYSLLLPEKF